MAELGANFQMMDGVMDYFFIMSSLSPAAFGILRAGLSESGSALRRLYKPTQSKILRMRFEYERGIKEIIRKSAEVTRAMGGAVGDVDSISISWSSDEDDSMMERVEAEAQLVSNGIVSRKFAVQRLFGLTEAEAQQIVEEAQEEVNSRRNATPVTPEPEPTTSE